MFALTYNAKNYVSFALKVGILSISFYYLYTKLVAQQGFWDPWQAKFSESFDILVLFGFLFMSAMNWLLETKKWQLLVNTHTRISFAEAFSQTLASLVISLPTPNRIGEYGAKAYFVKAEERKHILLLNAFGNFTQMGITCLFGLIGWCLWEKEIPVHLEVRSMVGFFLLFLVLLVMVYRLQKNGNFAFLLQFGKIWKYVRNIPSSIKLQVFGLSLGRYLLFSTQYFFILLFLGAEVPFWESLAIIYVMYFTVSLLPMFPFMDIVVKGSVAIWLFQSLGIEELTVLSTTLGIWIFNLVIPSILGSFLLIKAPN